MATTATAATVASRRGIVSEKHEHSRTTTYLVNNIPLQRLSKSSHDKS